MRERRFHLCVEVDIGKDRHEPASQFVLANQASSYCLAPDERLIEYAHQSTVTPTTQSSLRADHNLWIKRDL